METTDPRNVGGRPRIGDPFPVRLPAEDVAWLDERAEGNRSALIRRLVSAARTAEAHGTAALAVVARVLREFDVPKSDYSAVVQPDGRVLVHMVGCMVGDDSEVTRLNGAGWLIDQWRAAGLQVEPEEGPPHTDVRQRLADGHGVYVSGRTDPRLTAPITPEMAMFGCSTSHSRRIDVVDSMNDECVIVDYDPQTDRLNLRRSHATRVTWAGTTEGVQEQIIRSRGDCFPTRELLAAYDGVESQA